MMDFPRSTATIPAQTENAKVTGLDSILGRSAHDPEWLVVMYNTSFNIKLDFIVYLPSFWNGPIN